MKARQTTKNMKNVNLILNQIVAMLMAILTIMNKKNLKGKGTLLD